MGNLVHYSLACTYGDYFKTLLLLFFLKYIADRIQFK